MYNLRCLCQFCARWVPNANLFVGGILALHVLALISVEWFPRKMCIMALVALRPISLSIPNLVIVHPIGIQNVLLRQVYNMDPSIDRFCIYVLISGPDPFTPGK